MANDKKWAVMGGIALNVEYTRKYGFEATAAARVTAKLVAVPPPSAFQEAVQANISGRAQRLAYDSQGVIRLRLVDEDGKPAMGTRYNIKLKDGSMRSGTLNSNGEDEIEGLQAGESYDISFPDLDSEDWDIGAANLLNA